jgi:allantoate deiminase
MVRAAPRLALLALALACVAASPRAALGSSVGFGPEASRALDLEAWERLQELGEITDASDGSLERTFLSPASRRAMDVALAWMRDAGMRTWTDEAGNVHGRVDGAAAAAAPPSSSPSSSSRPSAAAVLVGSHLDTVRDAGKYDGALGVVLGIAAVKALVLEYGGAANLPRPIHVVGFSDEEGVRFGSTFLGSRALVGAVPDDVFDRVADADGLSFLDALRLNGFEGTRAAVERATLDPADVAAYVEVHIEQGPVLQRAREPAAAVSAIAGQTRLAVRLRGDQGHAGTVPMRGRKDAVAAAAEMIHNLETRCAPPPAREGERGEAAEEEAAEVHARDATADDDDESSSSSSSSSSLVDDSLVCTVGDVRVWPGASNVIAGGVNFTVDIRARTDAARESAVADAIQSFEATCATRGMRCDVERAHDAPATPCDADVAAALERAVRVTASEAAAGRGGASEAAIRSKQGGSSEGGDSRGGGGGESLVGQLVSGAGHDALAMAERFKIGMLFVRCLDGVSHSPLERAEPEDVAFAARALAHYLREVQEDAEGGEGGGGGAKEEKRREGREEL